tara:strand:- start:121 stop:447 length:327 start_codon:yes stop_codon:yes gene_type:complete
MTKNTMILDNLCRDFNSDHERIYKTMSNLSDAIDQIKYEKKRKENYNSPFFLIIESTDKNEPLVAMEVKRYFGGTFKTTHNSNKYNLKEMKKLYSFGGSGVKIYLRKG